jgi:hypothetical protein
MNGDYGVALALGYMGTILSLIFSLGFLIEPAEKSNPPDYFAGAAIAAATAALLLYSIARITWRQPVTVTLLKSCEKQYLWGSGAFLFGVITASETLGPAWDGLVPLIFLVLLLPGVVLLEVAQQRLNSKDAQPSSAPVPVVSMSDLTMHERRFLSAAERKRRPAGAVRIRPDRSRLRPRRTPR